MFNLILFGPPGSGKGTQSENIIAAFGLQHLSTGNLLRSEIANQTPLGLKAKTLMDAGQLVPDEVVIGMVDNFMNAHPEAKGFLFDGFPRTTAQCIALDALLKQKSNEINLVLALEVSEEELVKRFSRYLPYKLLRRLGYTPKDIPLEHYQKFKIWLDSLVLKIGDEVDDLKKSLNKKRGKDAFDSDIQRFKLFNN